MAKRNGAARLASSSRTNTINTKWLQNAVKSIGASAKNVLKNDFAPNLYSAVSSGAETAKSVVSALRTNTAGTGNVQRQISNNKYVKAANNAYKNALADLKAGNFNNDDRLTDALFGDMGFDDIDSFFDDGGFTFDDDGAESNVNVNVIGANSGNNDAMFAMSTQLQKNAEATLKTSQANMNAMIAMNSASMVQIQQFGSNIVSGLDAINSNLTQLIEFNNSNQTKFIESSLAFFERMGAKFDSETNTGGGNEKITADNLFGSGGGINMSQYKEYVKQQFKQTFQGSMVGMAASMIDDNMLDMLASNPLGFATEGLIKFMVPKIVTNAIVGAEEAFNAFMPSLLHKLADWGDSTATGLLGSAKRYIGKIFGVRAERIEGIDKGASIETGPVPFDGYTKMAITEIITKELREQTSYLKSIAENMGVDTKTARENSEVFDWKTGKYIKEKDVTTSIVDEVRSSVLDSMNQGRFGKELRRAGAGLKNEDDQKALQSMIDELMLRLEKNGKFMKFDRESLSDPTSDYRKILSDLSGNYSLKVYLDKYIQDMAEANPYAMMDMSRAIFNASSRRNATIKEIQSNPQKYNLYAARGLDEKALDDLVMDRHKETKVNYEEYEKDETGKFKLNSLGKKIRRGPLETAEITDENGNVVTGYNGNIYETIKNGNIALKTGAESNAKGEINERDKNGGYLAQLSSTTGKGLQNTLAAILNGDSNGALNAIGETFLKQVETIYTGFRENFLDPLKTTLFGKKDEDGFSRDGIFSGIQNSFKDAAGMIQWHITGKSFKDSKGEMHENKEDGDSVIGNLKSMATNIKQGVMEKLFGKTVTDENGNEVKTKGIMAKFQDVVNEGLVGWQEAIFGKELDEEERANLKESMIKNLNERLPASMTGAAVGTGVGLMAGGSLLGTLIGGPVGGAAFGAAIGFASKSEKFQEYLFGKKDENGDRTGGLISKGVQDFFKKNKGFIIGGTALGAAKGALTGGGLLGTLVGGPIGGALLGMASSLVVKSHMFEEFLHGDPKTGQKGIIDSFKSVFKRNKSDEQTAKGLGGKALGMGLLGAAGGALTASVVGKMGILGAALTPFGPVGGALVGLGLSIRAQKDNFHTWLFGEKDEEGNKKSEGVLGQFKNMLVANVFHPLKNMAADIFEDAKLTIKYSILDPIRFAIEPIGNALMDIGGKIKDKVMGIFDAGADMLKTNIINPLRDFLFAPITKAITGITKVVYGVTKRVVTFPFRLLDSAVKFSQSLIVDAFKALKKVTIDPIMMLFKNTIIKPTKALFKGLFKAVGFAANILIKKPLDVVGGVTNYVGDKLNRVGKDDRQIRDNGGIEDDWHKQRKLRREQKKIEFANAKKHSRERRIRNANEKAIAKATNNQYVQDTAENRKRAELAGAKINWRIEAEKTQEQKEREQVHMDRNAFNTTDFDDMTPENQQTSILMKIQNFLEKTFSRKRNKGGDGADFDNGESSEDTTSPDTAESSETNDDAELDEDNKKKKKEKRRTGADQVYDDIEAAGGLFNWMFGRKKNNEPSEDEETEEQGGSGLGTRLKGISSIISRFSGKGYAEGTDNAAPGSAVVGENGPELVDFGHGGGRVYSNDHPLHVYIAGAKKGVLAEATDEKDAVHGAIRQLTEAAIRTIDKFELIPDNVVDSISEGVADITSNIGKSVKEYGIVGSVKNLFTGRNRDEESSDESGEEGGSGLGTRLRGIEHIASRFSGEGYANGTEDAEPGSAVVGEDGPELVDFGEGGGKVFSNKKPLQVFVTGIAPMALGGAIQGLLGSRTGTYDEEDENIIDGEAEVIDENDWEGQRLARQRQFDLDTAQLHRNQRARRLQTEIERQQLQLEMQGAKVIPFPGNPFALPGPTAGDNEIDGVNNDSSDVRRDAIKAAFSGPRVTSNSEPGSAEVTGDSASDTALDLVDQSNSDREGSEANQEAYEDDRSAILTQIDAQQRLNDAIAKGKSAEEQQEAIRKEEERATLDTIAENTGQQAKEQADFSKLWGSIFSKKGLITAALVAGIPMLLKFLKGVIPSIPDAVKDVIVNVANAVKDIVGNVVDVVKNFAGNVMEQFQWTGENGALGDSKSMSDKVVENVNRYGSIFGLDNGDGGLILNEDGEWDHQSGAIVNTIAVKGSEVIRNGLSKVNLTPKDLIKASGDDIIRGAQKAASETVVGKAASLVDNVIGKIIGFIDNIIGFIAKKTGKNITTGIVKNFTDDVCKVVSKHFNKIAKPIGKVLGVTAGLVSTGIGYLAQQSTWIALGAINGTTGAARLFQVDPEYVDATMVLISTAMGAFAGTTVGSILDIVNELVVSVTGVDVFTQFATIIYNALAGDEKAAILEEGKAAFQEDYVQYQEDELKKQYETMKAAGLIDANMTEEEFIGGVRSGDIKADYDSFADYNDNQHQTLGSRMGKGMTALKKGAQKKLQGIKDYWGGKTESSKVDSNGNIYIDNHDGTWQVTSAQGEDLGYISEDAVPEDAQLVEKHTEGQWSKLTKGASKWLGKAGKAIGDWGAGMRKFWTSDTQTVFYLPDGSFYDGEGNHYTANGDKMKDKISQEELSDMLYRGALIREEKMVRESTVRKAVKQGIANMQESWKNATETFGVFTNWIKDTGASIGKFVAGGAKAGFNAVHDFFISDTESVFYLPDGSYYDGSGKHFTGNGEPMGDDITPEELDALITSGGVEYGDRIIRKSPVRSVIDGFVGGVKSGWEAFTGGVGWIKDKIVGGVKGLADLGKRTVDKVHDFFISEKESVFYLPDGTYYDGSGKHFTANGDALGDDITLDELDALINTGGVEYGDRIIHKSPVREQIDSFIAGGQKAWESFSTGVTALGKRINESPFVKGLKSFSKGAAEFLFSDTQTVFYDSDGTFYDGEGNHYSASGEELGDTITKDELQALIYSGALTRKEETIRESGLRTTIDTAVDNVKTGLGNAWGFLKEKSSQLYEFVTSGSVIAKVGEFYGGKIQQFADHLLTKKVDAWYDPDGGYYVSNGSTYDYYNSNGDLVVEGVGSSEVASLISSGTLVKGEARVDTTASTMVSNIGKSVTNLYENLGKGVAEMHQSVREAADTVIESIKEHGLVGGIAELFKKQTSKVWFDANGNYYKKVGSTYSYYNANNDLIASGVSEDDVLNKVTSGLLTEGTVQTDSAAHNAVKKIQSKVKEAWDNALDTVSSGWNSFINWITGGSGGKGKNGHSVAGFDKSSYGNLSIMSGIETGKSQVNKAIISGNKPNVTKPKPVQNRGYKITAYGAFGKGRFGGRGPVSNVGAAAVANNGNAKGFPTYQLTDDQIRGIANVISHQQPGNAGSYAVASELANLVDIDGSGSVDELISKAKTWYPSGSTYYDQGYAGTASLSQGAVNAAYEVLKLGKRTVPRYVDRFDNLSDIKEISTGNKRSKSSYKPHVTKITNNSGKEYTFWGFPGDSTGAFGYTSVDARKTYGDYAHTLASGASSISGSNAPTPLKKPVEETKTEETKTEETTTDTSATVDTGTTTSVTTTTTGGTSGSSGGSSSGSILDVFSGFISEFGSKAMDAALFGVTDTNWSIGSSPLGTTGVTSGTSGSTTTTSGGTTAPSGSVKRVVLIGDSRTVGLQTAVGSKATYNTGSGGTTVRYGVLGDNQYFFGACSQGLSWLKSSGWPAAKKYFDSNTAVIIWLGVNDFGPKSYLDFLQSVKGDLNGAKLYYAEVGQSAGKYDSRNVQIKEFNDTIQAGLGSLGAGWIPVQDAITSVANTKGGLAKAIPDGLHYINDVYKAVWNRMCTSVGFGGFSSGKGGSGKHRIAKVNPIPKIKEIGGRGIGAVKDFFGGLKRHRNINTGGRGTYYSQTDPAWANDSYGNDGATMRDTGCGPAAMAMVASDITGSEVTPTEMANFAEFTGMRDETGTNANFIDLAANSYGLYSGQQMMPDAGSIYNAAASGPTILLGQDSSGSSSNPYTDAGHYVVADGVDNSGNIMVKDPLKSSISKYSATDIANTTGSMWGFGGGGTRRRRNGLKGRGGSGQKIVNIADYRKKHKNEFVAGGRGVDRTQWLNIVRACKKAIAAQKPGYSQSRWIYVTVAGVKKSVRTDCSGYVSLCMRYYGVWPDGTNCWTGVMGRSSSTMKNTGFTPISWPGWDGLTEGDILVNTQSHTEIFAYNKNGKHYVYNCGSNNSTNSPVPTVTGKSSFELVWLPGLPGKNAVVADPSENYSYNGADNYSGGTSGTTDTSSGSSGQSTSMAGIFGNFFAELGNRAINGMMTGNYNNDWDSYWAAQKTAIEQANAASTSTTTTTGETTTGMQVSGGANAKTIWDYLKSIGMTNAGAAGMMGNIEAESGLQFNNVENQLESKIGYNDQTYTAAVDSGEISKDTFLHPRGAGTQYGYGLVQWTSPGRKEGLYNLVKSRGVSIADPQAQLDWLATELNQSYQGVFNTLKSTNSLQVASDKVLGEFEIPANWRSQSGARAAKGQKYYDQFAGGSGRGRATVRKRGGYGPSTAYKPSTTANKIVNLGSSATSNIMNAYGISAGTYDYNVIREAERTISSSNGDADKALKMIIKLLTSIAGNSAGANEKLSMLENLKSYIKPTTTNTYNITGGGKGTGESVQKINNNKANKNPLVLGSEKNISRNQRLAERIASGL